MSDESRESAFPWGNLAALVVLFTGAISWFLDPISTSRPAKSGSEIGQVDALQSLEVRLWQDPLEAALDSYRAEKKGADDTKLRQIHGPKLRNLQQEIARLRKKQDQRPDGDLLIMPVLIPGGSRAEVVEQRRRARHAVLSGLAVAGLAPVSEEHIGFFRPIDHEFKGPDSVDSGFAKLKPPAAGEGPIRDGLMAEVVPFEFFRPLGGHVDFTGVPYKQVLVCWLQCDLAEAPNEGLWRSPLHQIALLGMILGWDHHETGDRNIQVKVLGPPTSSEFARLYGELLEVKMNEKSPLKAHISRLRNVKIYAATPTVPDDLFSLLLGGKTPRIPPEEFARLLKENQLGVEVFRTIPSDEATIWEMIKELGLRNVKVSNDQKGGQEGAKERGTKAPVPEAGRLQHIALLSEWDTLYGRTLPFKFAQLAKGDPDGVATILSHLRDVGQVSPGGALSEYHSPFGDTIHYYSYLRGIDGRKPGDEADKKKDDESEKRKPPQEATEGENQSDYLRRQAAELKRMDHELRRRGEGGLRAVGVLGSDVYDVLMVLRSLRKVLPDAVFFTNHYDARLGMRGEWSATRNLVIVSPYGAALDRRWQGYIEPFRDSYQTAIFAATLTATDLMPMSVCRAQAPVVYEVGRDGLIQLHGAGSSPGLASRAPSPRRDTLALLKRIDLSKNPLVWGAICAVLIGMVVYRSRENFHRPKRTAGTGAAAQNGPAAGKPPGAGDRPRGGFVCLSEEVSESGRQVSAVLVVSSTAPADRREPVQARPRDDVPKPAGNGEGPPGALARLYEEAMTDGWLMGGVIVAFAFAVVCVLARLHPGEEPFYYFRGVSVWPSEIVRLIAGLLACYFLAKGRHLLRNNHEQICEQFALPEAEAKTAFTRDPRAWWRSLKEIFCPWDSSQLKAEDPQYVDGEKLWLRYLQAGRLSARIVRVLVYSLVYMGCGYLLLQLTGLPKVPARGAGVFLWDQRFMLFGGFLSVALVMYVYDATSLHCNFVRTLNEGATWWPPETEQKFSRTAFLQDDVREYIDIRLIADRSDYVSRLIYFPFLVVILMIAARTAYFDDWTWPPGLILIFTANLAVATYNALRLYATAIESKNQALEALRNERHKRMAAGLDERARKVFDETIEEIEGMKKGAFAPFWEQAVVRAVLYSSGGLGLGSILQTLPQFFSGSVGGS